MEDTNVPRLCKLKSKNGKRSYSMDNLDRILLFLLGICVLLMSIVTIANPDGYYMQSVEGIIFTCFIGAIGVTMIIVSFFSIYFKE